MANPVSEAVSGLALLPRGLALVVRRPRNFALGAIPPAITSVLFVIVVVALVGGMGPIVGWLTPFARNWSDGAQSAVQIAIGVALVGTAVLLMVVTFTALTLAIGGPIYDKISEYVDGEFGEVPTFDEPLARSIGRAVRQSLALIAVSALGALPLFLAGFIPVIGQSVVPVVAAMFGGWLLTIELLGGPFERRGPAEHRRATRAPCGAGDWHVWGFAAPTFALLADPVPRDRRLPGRGSGRDPAGPRAVGHRRTCSTGRSRGLVE